MRRRNLLLGIGATAGAGAALGTGAFTSATSDREMSITVADDADGLLSLSPYDGPNGEYVDDSDDRLSFEFGDDTTGLTRGSAYEFDRTFRIGNQGTQTVYVWTETSSAAFPDDALYVYRTDPTVPFEAGEAEQVDVGGDRVLGVYVDTTGVDADTYQPTVTIRASDEPPEGTQPGDEPGDEPDDPEEIIPSVLLDSVSSLLDANQEPLTDDSNVAIRAEPSAFNDDAEDGGDNAVPYPDDVDIPVAAIDGNVVGVTGPFVATDTQFGTYGNEEFLLNAYDDLLGGGGTVLHDEGHGQFYTYTPNGGDDFRAFGGYVDDEGYTYEATTDLSADLSDADAVVITSPSEAFTDAELDDLATFVDDGGVVFLHSQSDFSGFDATDNINEVAEALSASFRFNDDQVFDEENNAGSEFRPETENFNESEFPGLFEDREGLGLELDPTEEYEVEVTEVTDGDTLSVEFDDGTVETVRTVGHDTPETGSTADLPEEWEGIDDPDTLKTYGDEATTYAEDALPVGETVTLSFDESEGIRGDFGRLLGLVETPEGDLYNEAVIADGYARVYHSGLGLYDQFWSAEADARANDRGLWSESDVTATPVVGDGPVEELFVPYATAVDVDGGSIPDDRVPVESEAGDPLVGVDEGENLALLGGPLPAESFEEEEGGPGVEVFGNYVFLANLIDALTDGDRAGDVLIDGGHGQFAADYALSAEDAAFFQRYLEGFAIGFEGTNDYLDEDGPALGDARALIVTAPDEGFSGDEVNEIESFRDDGGAVILASAGSDDAGDARDNLDDLADALGTDLRTGDPVSDEDSNLGGPENPATDQFDDSFDLFGAYGGDGDGGDGSALELEDIVYDPNGEPVDSEYVEFLNDGSDDVDLDGYTVSDAADNSYTFDEVTLGAGETIRLYSGDGDDTDDEVYWGSRYIWNNDGDTVFVDDPSGTTVIEYSYEG